MEFLEQALIIIGVLSALGIFLFLLALSGTLLYIYMFSRYAERYQMGEVDVGAEQLREEESKVEVLEPRWKE